MQNLENYMMKMNSSSNNNMKYYIAGGVAALFLIILIIVLSSGGSKPDEFRYIMLGSSSNHNNYSLCRTETCSGDQDNENRGQGVDSQEECNLVAKAFGRGGCKPKSNSNTGGGVGSGFGEVVPVVYPKENHEMSSLEQRKYVLQICMIPKIRAIKNDKINLKLL